MRNLEPDVVLRDRYRLVELVGQGGAGAVWRADDLRLAGRITAVKAILPDVGSAADRADRQAQFHREASMLARLDHPALPKVSDYFEDDGTDFLVMDYVDGPDLRQVVDAALAAGELLDVERVLGWADQLLDAVAYLHAQSPPVLHRDIKPANIKLVAGERIKLVDFGLVKAMDPADPRTLTVARGVGSLPYTPLEQYAGDTGHTDVRADLYAVGATLYHLVTGRPPDTAQDRFLLPNALTRPRRLNPDVPSRVESAILTAMALHPERRPPTAQALRALLVGDAPVLGSVELGTAGLAWRQAIWDNAGLIALVSLLVLLTVVATWQATAASAPAATPTASAGSTATAPIATPTGPAAAAPAGS